MLAAPLQVKSSTAPLVAGLLILVLAAIAMALPPAPIATTEGTNGLGTLESPARFSSGLAEQNAAAGYGYLTIDLSDAKLSKKSLWREELKVVAQRRFGVWGWIDTKRAVEEPTALVSALNLAGVYVYGPDAVDVAAACRAVSTGRPVIPVVRAGEQGPSGAPHGVLVDLDTWLDSEGEFAHPILIADQLSAADVARAVKHARELDAKNPKLLVARVAVDK